MSLLSVNDLHVAFGETEVLRGVSFDLAPGETLGVVGESGCGKSMTGFAIMGMLQRPGRVTQGSIKLEGRELAGLSEREYRQIRGQEIALVMQDPFTSLNPMMRVGDQIAESYRLHQGLSMAEARVKAVEMLDKVGVPSPEESARKYPHQMSGGQKQRVVIAMAFACSPKVLIADEPTTALDVTLQAQILRLLRELQEKEGTGVILISHDIGAIASVSHRIAVFYAGKIVETGTSEQVLRSPAHPYTRSLLNSLPRAGQDRLESIAGSPPDFAQLRGECAFADRCVLRQAQCDVEPQITPLGDGHLAACYRAREVSESTEKNQTKVPSNVVESPLHSACAMGIRPEVEKLLKEGFDVNTRNAEGETALFSCRQPELYDLLVQYRADINLKNFKGESLLYRASFYGVSWIVDKLLADGVDLESRDHQQETALFASIYKLASAPVTQKLIEAGAKFQIVDAEGWTPLHLAASANNVRAAEILIGAGSSRNAVDQNGNSPISIAEQMGSAAVLKLLTGRPQSPSDPHLELRSEIYTGLEMGQWQAIAYGLGTADQTKHVLQSPASDFVRSMVLLLPDVLERVTGLASRVVDPSDDENNGTYEAIQELLDQLWKCQQMLHSLMESIYLTEIFPREFLYIIGSIDSAAKEFKMWEPML